MTFGRKDARTTRQSLPELREGDGFGSCPGANAGQHVQRHDCLDRPSIESYHGPRARPIRGRFRTPPSVSRVALPRLQDRRVLLLREAHGALAIRKRAKTGRVVVTRERSERGDPRRRGRSRLLVLRSAWPRDEDSPPSATRTTPSARRASCAPALSSLASVGDAESFTQARVVP